MKHLQPSKFTGYVTLSVKGDKPELFFQECMAYGIEIWDIRKKTDSHCQGNIKLHDIHIIRKVNRKTNYKLSFTDKQGYPFLIKRLMRSKELLIACIISILLILYLSNILWKITITGVSKEVEQKISEQLTTYGVHVGSWLFKLESPRSIQQKLVKDIPEILWVGVKQKGTTFTLEGVEKTIVKKEEVTGPRHLIATKKGVIKKVFVKKGQSKIRINDMVSPGDVLVSGILNDQEDPTDDKKEIKKSDIVSAEADIIAQTWYEVTVSIPLETKQEILTGEQEKAYYLGVGEFQVPIWTFGSSTYEEVDQEMYEKPVYLFKWKLPLRIIESILSEKMYNREERTKEEAISIGIAQAKHDLLLELGPEAQIISEDILHEAIENGKVRLQLYMTVEEDISKAEPIIQGD